MKGLRRSGCVVLFFIYLFIHERQSGNEREAEGEAGSMQGANMGLDPGTPGSHPELKADT